MENSIKKQEQEQEHVFHNKVWKKLIKIKNYSPLFHRKFQKSKIFNNEFRNAKSHHIQI